MLLESISATKKKKKKNTINLCLKTKKSDILDSSNSSKFSATNQCHHHQGTVVITVTTDIATFLVVYKIFETKLARQGFIAIGRRGAKETEAPALVSEK